MITSMIARFDAARPELLAHFKSAHPDSYEAIVHKVVETVADSDGDDAMDPTRITCIDHGDYQGDQLFIIAKNDYQPSEYWYVQVGYGSCSGCDTLQAICGYSDEPPTDEQAKDYLGLALNIVQGIKKLGSP